MTERTIVTTENIPPAPVKQMMDRVCVGVTEDHLYLLDT